MAGDGYVLLCGHGRHQDGRLLRFDGDGKPAKEPTGSDRPGEWGRFPSEDVGERLLEQLAFANTVRLVRIGVAETPEAQQTAHVLYQRLSGRRASDALRNVSRPPQSNFTVDRPRWAALLPDCHDAPEPLRRPNDAPVASASSSRATISLPYTVPWQAVRGLTPIFDSDTADQRLDDVERLIAQELASAASDPPPGILLIGHNPQLSWLAGRLHRRSPLARLRPWQAWLLSAPVRAGEVVCVKVAIPADAATSEEGNTRGPHRWRGDVVWTITPDDGKAYDDVIAKVKSKMETAKQFSSVITLVLTALLVTLQDRTRWEFLGAQKARVLGLDMVTYSGRGGAQVAFVLLLLALGLFVRTMFVFDQLLMPPRFWAERHSRRRRRWLPARPPSSSAWVVFRNMQRCWFYLFLPATILTGTGLLVFGFPLLGQVVWQWQLAAFAMIALLATVVLRVLRPVLGSED
jgi:hypothetical protein